MLPTPKDDTLVRSLSLLFVGTAITLLFMQGYDWMTQPPSTKSAQTEPSAKRALTTEAPAQPQPSTAQGTYLVVDLSERQVSVYTNQQIQTSYPIAIGQDGWETPVGQFAVRQKELNPSWQHPITGERFPGNHPKNPLGNRWIGFWFDGEYEIGFHGTNQDELIGQAVSHGCIRLRNRDIEALYQKVSTGTPVIVRP